MASHRQAGAPLVVQGPDDEDTGSVGRVPLPSADILQKLIGSNRSHNSTHQSSRNHRSRKTSPSLSAREINASMVKKPSVPRIQSSNKLSVVPELVIEQPSESEPVVATGSVPLPPLAPLETLPAPPQSLPQGFLGDQINESLLSAPASMIVDEGHSSLPPLTDAHLPIPTMAFETDTDRVEAAFEEMVDTVPRERSQRPLVVLDGANVGWHHGHHEFFSVAGLTHAIHDLTAQYDVDVVAFLPSSYFRSRPAYRSYRPVKDTYASTSNDALPNALQHDTLDSLTSKVTASLAHDEEDRRMVEELHRLYRLGLVVPVPAGDHDDAYILHYARSHDGFVVSNDQYRDYIASMTVQSIQWSMQLWLRDNRCGYAFVGDELVLNPSSTFSLTLLHHNHRCQLAQQGALSREVSLTRRPPPPLPDHLMEELPIDQPHHMDTSEGSSSLPSMAQVQRQSSSLSSAAGSAAIPVTEWMTLSLTAATPGGPWTTDVLSVITNAAALCFAQHRPSELRHMLLARISLLLQMGRVREAEADWTFAHTYLALPEPQRSASHDAMSHSTSSSSNNHSHGVDQPAVDTASSSPAAFDAELHHYWSLIRAYQEHGMDTDDL